LVKAFDPPLTAAEVAHPFAALYRNLRSIKSGGQGAVFRAEPVQPGSDVALKILFPGDVQERTDREIKALQSFSSRHLVALQNYGKCPLRNMSCSWIATTFIEGESLASALGRGPLIESSVVKLAEHVGEAVRTMWRGRVVHRDLKPDNIMIEASGNAVVIDLGIARHVDMSALTTTGKTWGTQGYLSPEQVQAIRALTCRSDIFALGIVMQQCLLGRHPTNGDQMALVNGGPRTAGLRAGLDQRLVQLIDSMVDARVVYRPLPRGLIEQARVIATAKADMT
jgi:eukaryotic-like serine/threonine-protein kinase